jgi:hypothetical protein
MSVRRRDGAAVIRQGAAIVLAALIGDALGMPGAWMLGPLLVTAVVAARGLHPLVVPERPYVAAQAVVGAATSASFTPTTLSLLAEHALRLLVLVGALLLLSVLVALVLARATKLDLATAVIGMLPGGAAVMVALSEAVGGDARLVAVMQYSRLLLVILSMGLITPLLPGTEAAGLEPVAMAAHLGTSSLWLGYGVTLLSALLGAWLGLRLGLPGGAVVGPALLGAGLGAAGIPHGVWPPAVLAGAFVLIGVQIGARFDGPALRRAGRLALPLVWSIAVLIGGSLVLAYGFARTSGVDLVSAYLATTPGGLDSAVALALDTEANAALVIAVNMARFLAITLLAPPALRRALTSASGSPARRRL